MPSKFPPDAWEVTRGVWGVDVDRTEDSTRTRSGKFGIEFLNSGTRVTIQTLLTDLDIEHGNDSIPGVYDITILWTADRANAGDTLAANIIEVDNIGSIVTTTAINPGIVTTPNTFEYHTARLVSLPGSRQFRIELDRPTNQDFAIFIDSVTVRKVPAHFMGALEVAQSIPDNTWTTVINLGASPFGRIAGIAFNVTTGVATIPFQASYIANAMATFASLKNGQQIESRLNVNSGAFILGSSALIGAAGQASVGFHRILEFNQNDTIEFQVRQSGAGVAKSLAVTDQGTYFGISRMI